jgi:hypothetical protein
MLLMNAGALRENFGKYKEVLSKFEHVNSSTPARLSREGAEEEPSHDFLDALQDLMSPQPVRACQPVLESCFSKDKGFMY